MASDDGHAPVGAKRLRNLRRKRARLRLDLRVRPGQQPQGRQALRQPRGIAIELQRGDDGGEANFIDTQRPFQWIAGNRLHMRAPADDEADLRAAEQLVAGKGHDIGAVGHRLAHGFLLRQAISRHVDQRARAEIVEQRLAGGMGDARDLASVDRRRETLDAVVGCVGFDEKAGFVGDGAPIIVGMRAIGRADLDELHPGARHDVGHTE